MQTYLKGLICAAMLSSSPLLAAEYHCGIKSIIAQDWDHKVTKEEELGTLTFDSESDEFSVLNIYPDYLLGCGGQTEGGYIGCSFWDLRIVGPNEATYPRAKAAASKGSQLFLNYAVHDEKLPTHEKEFSVICSPQK